MKTANHPVGVIEVLSRIWFRLRSSRVLANLQGILVRGLLLYSVSSAPFIIHISAVYRAGVTAVTGITSMLERSQALPSEETVCVLVQQLHMKDSLIYVHVYV